MFELTSQMQLEDGNGVSQSARSGHSSHSSRRSPHVISSQSSRVSQWSSHRSNRSSANNNNKSTSVLVKFPTSASTASFYSGKNSHERTSTTLGLNTNSRVRFTDADGHDDDTDDSKPRLESKSQVSFVEPTSHTRGGKVKVNKQTRRAQASTSDDDTHLPPVQTNGILASQVCFSNDQEQTTDAKADDTSQDTVFINNGEKDTRTDDVNNADDEQNGGYLFSDTEDLDQPPHNAIASRSDGFYINTSSSAGTRRHSSRLKSAVSVASTDPRSAMADVEYDVQVPAAAADHSSMPVSRQSRNRRHSVLLNRERNESNRS